MTLIPIKKFKEAKKQAPKLYIHFRLGPPILISSLPNSDRYCCIIYLKSVYSYNIIDTFYFSIFKCIDCLNIDKFDTFNES